ncbi:PucR family transcriptional regulator [Nigerium massiliense]
MTRRLAAASAEITTAALTKMAERYPWFRELDADHRASITLVVRSGIDGFSQWFSAGADESTTTNIFESAPRSLRTLSLQQTVAMIRATIDTVGEQIGLMMPRGDRAVLETAMLHYAREVAFDAADVYARAAEERGVWDARLESLVMDAVIRGEADESVVSRASTLGWRARSSLAVVIGDLPEVPQGRDTLRHLAARAKLDVLSAPQGDRLVALLGGSFADEDEAVAAASALVSAFGPGPIVVGPVVTEFGHAVTSARAALSGRRAASAWPGAPRPVAAGALLPERALSGDGQARRTLAGSVYLALREHGGDLLETLETYLELGTIEASARALFIHANTVRYRLAKVHEVTGYDPQDSRDAYALRLGLTLGRLLS